MIDSLRAAQRLTAIPAKKGAPSKLEDAVKWRLFDQTVNQTREAFASLPDGELRDTIDKAISNVRKQKGRQGRGRSRK
jgi:hypothetical protein